MGVTRSCLAIGSLVLLVTTAACKREKPTPPTPANPLDAQLSKLLKDAGFTGTIESSLEKRLGRPVNRELADLGRLVFFDRLPSIHSQPDGAFGNPCSGCHAPNAAMADSQHIAIGVDSANNVVGPGRTGSGPRNQRRTPTIINSGFFPKLMWDGRFHAPSGSPFDNSKGFTFPPPEGTTAFPPNDPVVKHLLIAQAHIPPTELPEMSGFTGAQQIAERDFGDLRAFATAAGGGSTSERRSVSAMSTFSNRQPFSTQARLAIDDVVSQSAPCTKDNALFDDQHGERVPFENPNVSQAIRQKVEARFNANARYVELFGKIFPDIAKGSPITYAHIAQALAEFQISLTFANAPIDRFARGDASAMSEAEKRGAVVFFTAGRCVECHAVRGEANEMFSDFRNRRIGVPQLAPEYGKGKGNFLFDGDNCDQDFGAFNSTGVETDKYAFRTSPLRNVSVQPTFFHNGAFSRLEDAVRHHLDVVASANGYDPAKAGVPDDLRIKKPPVDVVLQNLDPILAKPIALSGADFNDLVQFVRTGLLDPRAEMKNLCAVVPTTLPSGMKVGTYEGCTARQIAAK